MPETRKCHKTNEDDHVSLIKNTLRDGLERLGSDFQSFKSELTNEVTHIINTSVRGIVKSEVSALLEMIDKQQKEIDGLKEALALEKSMRSKEHAEMVSVKESLLSMGAKISEFDNMRRKKTFLIRNFPENTQTINGQPVSSCEDAVLSIAEAIGLDKAMIYMKECFRLGKPHNGDKRRLILVKANEKTVKLFLQNARRLKGAGNPLNEVYIQENLPPEMTKKLADMRKKAFEHRKSHPGEKAYVANKKLYINGTVVEEAKPNF